MRRKLGIFWFFLFSLIFLLSQDYLYVRWLSVPEYLGFPSWLFWFALVHLLFIAVFYWFSKKYWEE